MDIHLALINLCGLVDNAHTVIESIDSFISDYTKPNDFDVDFHLARLKESIEGTREREVSILKGFRTCIDVLRDFRHRSLSLIEEIIKQYKKFETDMDHWDSKLITLR